MKGLLIKDLQLMKNQGKGLIAILLVVAVFLGMSGMSPGFVTSYITLVFSIFTATSISYDEFDNCFPNLLVLPVSRKDYVNEKYVFGAISAAAAWITGVLFGSVLRVIQDGNMDIMEWGAECISYMAVAVVFLSFMIPLRLKFEGEKGRVVLPILIAGAGVAFYIAVRAADMLEINVEQHAVSILNSLGATGIIAGIILIAAGGYAVSFLCSRHILMKKEF